MVSEGGRSEYGRGYVCTRCFASVERYIALKIKYIELEAALMSKMSIRGIAAVAAYHFREVNSSKGKRSIMTFHFQWAT